MTRIITLLIAAAFASSTIAIPINDEGEEEKITTYKSADQILRKLPSKLSPKKEGWTRTEVDGVSTWLIKNIPGEQFSAKRKINHVSISKNSQTKNWDVRITLTYTPMQYMSWKMQERLAIITISGDAKFAEKAEKKYKIGRRIQVSGTIKSTSWSHRIQPQGERWKPKHMNISLKDVTVR